MVVASSDHFVGRVEELAQLLAALERAEHGRPQLVLLTGEAGVGKTRLLIEFASRVELGGVRVLTGSRVELGDIGLPYLPVVAPSRHCEQSDGYRSANRGSRDCARPRPVITRDPAGRAD